MPKCSEQAETEGDYIPLSDRLGLPRSLAERINDAFSGAMGRILAVNDIYGTRVMRETVLDETNNLRRFVLGMARQLLDGYTDTSGPDGPGESDKAKAKSLVGPGDDSRAAPRR